MYITSRFIFLLSLLLLSYQTSRAQSSEPILHWMSSDGIVGNYHPNSQTLTEYQLPFDIIPHSVNWLSGQTFIYEANDNTLHIVDTLLGEEVCSLSSQLIERWNISQMQRNIILLYQTNADNTTSIIRLNWMDCQQKIIASVEGRFLSASPSPDKPLLALYTVQTEHTKFYLVDLITGDVNILAIPMEETTGADPYWTLDSTGLIIQDEDKTYLVTPETGMIEKLAGISGGVWTSSDMPVLLRQNHYAGLATQFWTLENGQVGELLFEIEDENYDHLPGFSPDYHYYAYTSADNTNPVYVYDLQNSDVTEIAIPDALRRWSADSRWLALYQMESGKIHLYDMQTGTHQTYDGYVFWLADELWSPDGQLIVFWQRDVDEEYLVLVNPTDDSITPLFSRPATEAYDFYGAAHWSPDNAYLWVETRKIEDRTTCYTVVEVATQTSQELGCGDWTLKWSLKEIPTG